MNKTDVICLVVAVTLLIAGIALDHFGQHALGVSAILIAVIVPLVPPVWEGVRIQLDTLFRN